MKRIFTFIFLLVFMCCFAIAATAQTQQGIVKTRGRLNNGQIVAGTRLSGATITLNFGNSLVSGSQGKFSFNVPIGKAYSLVMAEKNGYTLADPEYTRRSFMYSASNPFYVVLEDVNQRLADINEATRKVRRTLTAQLQKREDEIEALKEQNKLSEEEYQKRLQELYDNQSKSEELVKEMAERYASTDYDQLDEFNRQVQMYIETGELQKADSMVHSKGDIEKRIIEYHKVVAANQNERAYLEKRLQALQQSVNGTARVYEDLAQNLFQLHEIYMQQFRTDSALYFMKLRADLDTTMIAPLFEYAKLCYEQNRYEESRKYYQMCLNSPSVKNDTLNYSVILNNIGLLHVQLESFDKAEYYYISALKFLNIYSRRNSVGFWKVMSALREDIGVLYQKKKDNFLAQKYLLESLKIREIQYEYDSILYMYDLAIAQQSVGLFYLVQNDSINSKKYLVLSLKKIEKLYEENPDKFRADFATINSNLGCLYSLMEDEDKEYEYYKLALDNFEILFKQNPEAYREQYAKLLLVMGDILSIAYWEEDQRPALLGLIEEYLKLSFENFEILSKLYPDKYHEELAACCLRLGEYYQMKKIDIYSMEYYEVAASNYEILYKSNPEKYLNILASVYTSYVLSYDSRYKNYKKYTQEYCNYIERAYQLQEEVSSKNSKMNFNFYRLQKLYLEYLQYLIEQMDEQPILDKSN